MRIRPAIRMGAAIVILSQIVSAVVVALQNSVDIAVVAAAAEGGDPDAQFSLGASYAEGDGIPQDDAEAARWYQRAAEQGHVWAQNNLVVRHQLPCFKRSGVRCCDSHVDD